MTALLVRCRFPVPLCRGQNMNLERRIAVSYLVWSQCGCNAGRHIVKHVWGHSCCETLPLLCLSPVISCRWKQLCRMPAVAGYRSCPSLQSIRHCWEPSSRSGRSSRNWPWPRGWVLCDSVRSLPPPPWNVRLLLAGGICSYLTGGEAVNLSTLSLSSSERWLHLEINPALLFIIYYWLFGWDWEQVSLLPVIISCVWRFLELSVVLEHVHFENTQLSREFLLFQRKIQVCTPPPHLI